MLEINLKNANILIVDDTVANIDLLVGLLEKLGYTSIKSTTDPCSAVNLFKTFQPDIILLDLLMPNLSGVEVMKSIVQLIPKAEYLPILVLTAVISPEVRTEVLMAGAKDFLSKPFNLIEVGLRIKNLLETRFLYQQIETRNQILNEDIKLLLNIMDEGYRK